MGRSTIFTAAALVTILSACGTTTKASQAPGGPSAREDTPVVATTDGEVVVSCGGETGWTPSVMAEGIKNVLDQDEARRIFHGVLDEPGTVKEAGLTLFRDGVDVEWRVLSETDDSLTLGLGRWTENGPGKGAYILGLEREGPTWQVTGWGDCQLSPMLKAGHSRVEVSRYRGDAGGTRLIAEVTERECASGRDPGRFLHDPFVVETSRSVTLYWTSEPPTGSQDCQGNPSVERTVDLEEPLGTRTVLDGLSFPPRHVRMR